MVGIPRGIDSRVKGRWALVTGASQGIGLGIAEALAKHGAKLIITSRSEDKLQQVAQALAKLGAAQVEVVAADLSRPAEAQRLAERVLAITAIPADADAGALAREGQGLYLLVNNAGGGVATGFSALQGNPDDWEAMFHLNVHSPMRLTRVLAPALVEAAKTGPAERGRPGQGAVIVNIGSAVGTTPVPHLGAYCATKYALRGWSRCNYRELRSHNVKVVLVAPAWVDTPLSAPLSTQQTDMITVEDVAGAVLYAVDCSLSATPEEVVIQSALPLE